MYLCTRTCTYTHTTHTHTHTYTHTHTLQFGLWLVVILFVGLVAKCFCVGGKEEISAAFKGRNFGVGCPGAWRGCHSLRHFCRSTKIQARASQDRLSQRFQRGEAHPPVKAVTAVFPAMSNWTQRCYGEATMLFYDHEHIIESCAGVQQGDPFGPLYFCCASLPLSMTLQL